jgi:hypothetical protein
VCVYCKLWMFTLRRLVSEVTCPSPSTTVPLIKCLPNPCNNILILDNHVTVFLMFKFFCVCCVYHVFICWQTIVCWLKSHCSSQPLFYDIWGTPLSEFQGPRWLDLCMGVPDGVWLFLTFLFSCCCFVFLLNELNTNRCNLVFVILKSIQLYKRL